MRHVFSKQLKNGRIETTFHDRKGTTMKSMMMIFLGVLLTFALESLAQPQSYSLNFAQEEDPAYKIFKQGYKLILQVNWKEAQKKFSELQRHYQNSSYYDDASYWYAYSLKYEDEKKAGKALKKFLKEFPRSSYRGDALEDLAELQARSGKNFIVIGDSLLQKRLAVEAPDLQMKVHDFQIHQNWDPDFSFQHHLAVSMLTEVMKEEMDWQFGSSFRFGREKDSDEKTKLRIYALRGIAAEGDSESFRAVNTILLDRTENPRLREEALRLLTRYKNFNFLSTLKEVAKNDPQHRLRHGAIYYIGRYNKDKDAASEALIELFRANPKDRTKLKERLLYYIARIRTDRGMDFLVSVAKSDENYNLRESALYWLGRYGEGKKKEALYEILKRR